MVLSILGREAVGAETGALLHSGWKLLDNFVCLVCKSHFISIQVIKPPTPLKKGRLSKQDRELLGLFPTAEVRAPPPRPKMLVMAIYFLPIPTCILLKRIIVCFFF